MSIFIFEINRAILAMLFGIVAFFLYNIYFLGLAIISITISIVVYVLDIHYLDNIILLVFAWAVWVWWTFMTFYNKNKTSNKKDLVWNFSIVQKQKDNLIVHMNWKVYQIENTNNIKQWDMIKIIKVKNNTIHVEKTL